MADSNATERELNRAKCHASLLELNRQRKGVLLDSGNVIVYSCDISAFNPQYIIR